MKASYMRRRTLKLLLLSVARGLTPSCSQPPYLCGRLQEFLSTQAEALLARSVLPSLLLVFPRGL